MIRQAPASRRNHAGRVPAIMTAVLVPLSACSQTNEQRLPRVSQIAHWGHYEEAKDLEEFEALLDQDFIKLRLGPIDPRATFDLNGHTVALELVEAYKEIPPASDIEPKFYARTVDFCQDSDSYIKLRVNGHEVILLREQVKEVTLANGYRFLVSAPDIEDMRQREPSGLVLIRFK